MPFSLAIFSFEALKFSLCAIKADAYLYSEGPEENTEELTFETDQNNRNLSIKFKDNSLIFDVSISINLVSFKFQF